MILVVDTRDEHEGKYFRVSPCGNYRIAKTFHGGDVIYDAWFQKTMLACSKNWSVVMAALNSHSQKGTSSPGAP